MDTPGDRLGVVADAIFRTIPEELQDHPIDAVCGVSFLDEKRGYHRGLRAVARVWDVVVHKNRARRAMVKALGGR